MGVTRHVLTQIDRTVRDRTTRSSPIPRRIDELDTRTLGTLLGRSVTTMTRLDGTAGTTDRARFDVDGTTVFVKMAADATGARLFAGLARLGDMEVGFYRDLRDRLKVEVPVCLGVAHDPRTGRFLIALEDLAVRSAQFLDTLTPLTPDQAALAMETLAGVHAEPAEGLRWIGMNSTDPMLPIITRGLRPLVKKVRERLPELAPPAAAPLLTSYTRIAKELDAGPRVLLHGDTHPGNLYAVDGQIGLLDWQCVRRGNPMRDVTYCLVLGMMPEDRRVRERELIDHYLAQGSGITREQAWTDYRRMVAYVYVATTFTSGLGGLQGTTIADEGLRRAVLALDDLETLALFR